MSYIKCGRNGNVDKWHTYTEDETETSTNVILRRNGNVDKCHSNNVTTKRKRVDETETSTNDIITQGTKRKRRQMSYVKCGRNGNVDKWHTYTGVRNGDVDKCHTYRHERNGNVDKCQTKNVNETETSTNVKLTMWTKRKRQQMSYLKCGRNGNVDKWLTYAGDETETSTNVILTDVNETETSTNVKLAMWTKRKRWQMSYLRGERNGNVNKCHT